MNKKRIVYPEKNGNKWNVRDNETGRVISCYDNWITAAIISAMYMMCRLDDAKAVWNSRNIVYENTSNEYNEECV